MRACVLGRGRVHRARIHRRRTAVEGGGGGGPGIGSSAPASAAMTAVPSTPPSTVAPSGAGLGSFAQPVMAERSSEGFGSMSSGRVPFATWLIAWSRGIFAPPNDSASSFACARSAVLGAIFSAFASSVMNA